MLQYLLAVFAFLLLVASSENLKQEWEDWKETYEKVYLTKQEDAHRFNVWRDNRATILRHNSNKDNSYTLAINEFADLTGHEFKLYVNGKSGSCLQDFDDFKQKNKNKIKTVNPGMSMAPEDLPDSVDWTQEPGIVTPIKNQGSCGSCWAFSAAGSVESRYAISTGTLNSLSEQELVDCSTTINAGCDGGSMDVAFLYIERNNGLSLEDEYSYTAEQGTCDSTSYTHYDPINGLSLVEADNMTALMSAVSYGPVSVGIEANQVAFQFYSSGIIDGRCGTSMDHGVIAVGYGEDSDTGEKYWKIKNSWGTSWGEDGYGRICRDCDKNDDSGECCILCAPSYPDV